MFILKPSFKRMRSTKTVYQFISKDVANVDECTLRELRQLKESEFYEMLKQCQGQGDQGGRGGFGFG